MKLLAPFVVLSFNPKFVTILIIVHCLAVVNLVHSRQPPPSQTSHEAAVATNNLRGGGDGDRGNAFLHYSWTSKNESSSSHPLPLSTNNIMFTIREDAPLSTTMSGRSPSVGTCGGADRGNGVCSDGTCCSRYGWCGTTPDHCSGSVGGPSSPPGTCGGGDRGNGVCSDGTCCSQYGWCGTTPDHCSSGGGGGPSSPPGTCGGGDRGNGVCSDGACCSQFGWCGTTPKHCSGSGGPSSSPPTISPGSPSVGTCGGGDRGDGVCSDGNCCSQYGWCGTTPKYCSGGGGEGPSSPPGTCGGGDRGNGVCSDGNCCSRYGWCGTTPDHCSGSGGGGPSSPPPTISPGSPSVGTCGGGDRGNGGCSDGSCCSRYGWCGTTPDHCSGGGGQGPSSPPPTISPGSPSAGEGTINSAATVLSTDQVQTGINVKGDPVVASQQLVDEINKVTQGYSLYRQVAFVAHTIWESGSYQFREELDVANHGNYQSCDPSQPNDLPTTGKLYYGRGYIQLSWCYNYQAYGADRMFNNDPDLFYNQPELVATDDFYAMDSAAWFFETNVGDTTGQFGSTTNDINGQMECSGGSSEKARYRYQIFVALANTVGLTGYSESGCYN